MARSTSKKEIMRFAPVSGWNSRGSQPHCFNKPVPVTMNPPDIHTPFLPPNLLPSASSVISVSTGIHKLTDETCGFIAQMLVLQIPPQEIAWLTGISMHSVYCVWGNNGNWRKNHVELQ